MSNNGLRHPSYSPYRKAQSFSPAWYGDLSEMRFFQRPLSAPSFLTFVMSVPVGSNSLDLRLFALTNSDWDGSTPAYFEFVFASGIAIGTTSNQHPAVFAHNFPAGSVIYLRGAGPVAATITGAGGAGGYGAGDSLGVTEGKQPPPAVRSNVVIGLDDTYLTIRGGGGGGGGGNDGSTAGAPQEGYSHSHPTSCKIFRTPGSFVYTKRVGCKFIRVLCVGAGGNGYNHGLNGCGGASGGWTEFEILADDLEQHTNCIIGEGGPKHVDHKAGGTTYFGWRCYATGGGAGPFGEPGRGYGGHRNYHGEAGRAAGGFTYAGSGANSCMGGGGRHKTATNDPEDCENPGGGGGGGGDGVELGGRGGHGCIIIEEYD